MAMPPPASPLNLEMVRTGKNDLRRALVTQLNRRRSKARVPWQPRAVPRRRSQTRRSQTRRSQTRRSQTRRSQKRRRSSVQKVHKFKGPCMLDVRGLTIINSLIWDINQQPLDAMYLGAKVTDLELTQELCRGKLTLLIPAAFREVTDGVTVLYEVPISKSNINIKDILAEIYKFYNMTRVNRQDLENISAIESQTEKTQVLLGQRLSPNLRFNEFLNGNTVFNGLLYQSKGKYMVRLAPKLGPPIEIISQ